MSKSVEFNQLEGFMLENHITNQSTVIVSFRTERYGIFQISCRENGVKEIREEPSLNMFTKSDQKYIKERARIVWRIVHDSPSNTDRFER